VKKSYEEMTLLEQIEYAKKRATFSDRLSNVTLAIAILSLVVSVFMSFIK